MSERLTVNLAQSAADFLLHGGTQKTQAFPRRVLNDLAQVVLAEQSAVKAVTNHGNHRASKAREEGVRPSKRVPAQNLAARPLDSSPLQQVVGFQMQKLIQRTIRGRFEQSAGTKTKHIDGDGLARKLRQKEAAIPDEPLGAFEVLEGAALSLHFFALGFTPGQINLIGKAEIFLPGGNAHRDPVLLREADVAAAILGKLLEKSVRTLGKIEDDVPLQLPAPESPGRERCKVERKPTVNRQELCRPRFFEETLQKLFESGAFIGVRIHCDLRTRRQAAENLLAIALMNSGENRNRALAIKCQNREWPLAGPERLQKKFGRVVMRGPLQANQKIAPYCLDLRSGEFVQDFVSHGGSSLEPGRTHRQI